MSYVVDKTTQLSYDDDVDVDIDDDDDDDVDADDDDDDDNEKEVAAAAVAEAEGDDDDDDDDNDDDEEAVPPQTKKRRKGKGSLSRHIRSGKSKIKPKLLIAVIGKTRSTSKQHQNLPLASLKPSKSIIITSLRNQRHYNHSVVEKAKAEREDLAILQQKEKTLTAAIKNVDDRIVATVEIATTTVSKTKFSGSNEILKVEEKATAKVMKAEASSLYLMDQTKLLKERYTEAAESKQKAYNRETARLKQKYKQELQSLRSEMSQLQSTMYIVK